MPKLVAQPRIALALVGAILLLAVLLAVSSLAAGHAAPRTVASHQPTLWRNTHGDV